MAAVMTWLSNLASDPWFLWISGALVGVAIGLWLEAWVQHLKATGEHDDEENEDGQE